MEQLSVFGKPRGKLTWNFPVKSPNQLLGWAL